MAVVPVRNEDAIFAEYVTISCATLHHDEDDEAHIGMTRTARDFLKKTFGTISRFNSGITSAHTADVNGFSRINTLRKALAALDRGGWEQSYHQQIFHVRSFPHQPTCKSVNMKYAPDARRIAYAQESFLNSVVRVLFKIDPPGFFERSYPRLLEMNTWQSINQEILCVYVCDGALPRCFAFTVNMLTILGTSPLARISTPCHFGKTISVCLFVVALVFECPMVEISIYSICELTACTFTMHSQMARDILSVVWACDVR
jgi:hypothetical protein